MEPESSLPHSQEFTTFFYPEQDRSLSIPTNKRNAEPDSQIAVVMSPTTSLGHLHHCGRLIKTVLSFCLYVLSNFRTNESKRFNCLFTWENVRNILHENPHASARTSSKATEVRSKVTSNWSFSNHLHILSCCPIVVGIGSIYYSCKDQQMHTYEAVQLYILCPLFLAPTCFGHSCCHLQGIV